MTITEWARHRWLLTSTAAFAFSLSHLFIDFQIGLFGQSSSSISVLQAVLVATIGVTFGWWALAISEARSGSGDGLATAFVFACGWAFGVNGLMALFAAPPPSAGFPYQDITHIGSLIFGGLAALGLWGKVHEVGGVRWRVGARAGVLVALVSILEGVLVFAG